MAQSGSGKPKTSRTRKTGTTRRKSAGTPTKPEVKEPVRPQVENAGENPPAQVEGSPKKEEQEAKAKPKKGFRDTIVMTMVTILIGGVFGDFIVKRNIQAYNTEVDQFDNMAKNLEQSFAEARAKYSQALRNRRGQTQRLVRNIASDSYVLFNENYDAYDEAVKHWNAVHEEMASTIIDVTGCEQTYAVKSKATDDEKSEVAELRLAKIAPIREQMEGLTNAFKQFIDQKPEAAAKAFDKLMDERKFCPSYFITKSTTAHSVHKRFVEMHKKVSGYRLSDYVQCIADHDRNRSSYYRACTDNNDIDDAPACMAKVDEMLNASDITKPHAFCGHHTFDKEKYRIRDWEFNELDYYWASGDRFFRSFKEEYMIRECRKRLGFWGNSLDWSCENKIRQYLASS